MSGPNPHLFAQSASLRVRQVELLASDEPRRHLEKLARIVLDEMYQFVALLDVEGTLLEVNRAALEGAGIRLDDILGKPFWEARWWTVSRESQAHLREEVRRAASGVFVRYDVEVYGEASGEETIIIDFSLLPVKDTEGRVVFLLAEGRNITEKKRAEAEIARKNQELQRLLDRVRELDELKSQFFANVSHELRTPLALILGPAERLLATGDNLTGLQHRDLEVMRRNAATLLKQVNNLLDLSKLDAGRMQASYAEVDLARLVRTVAGHFDALAPQRAISYVVEAPECLPAQVDPEKVERVVLNLLSNAFKFVPEGGRIKCGLLPTKEGRVLLSVQDSGPGVRPELREHIFERFRQGDGGETRQFGGTGLGLSITKDFVELHGGTLGVTDAPGGGALFQVELPLCAPEGTRVRKGGEPRASSGDATVQGTLEELTPATAPPLQAEPQPDWPLVLVVEDNPELNRFISEGLAGEFRVATAADGQEGLQRALELRPDLIVSDIMMPRMSGAQMIRRLREERELDGLPILVLSAKADDALRVELLRQGAQDYVVKPFSTEELLARVRNLVSMKRARELLEVELSMKSSSLEALAKESARRKRQLELALEETRIARHQAEEASRAKSDFLNLISHELNTPLSAVLLSLEAVARHGVRPENTRSLERLQRASRRMKQLVAGLLEYARGDSRTLVRKVEPFDVGALAAEVLEEQRPEAERKGLALHLTAPALPPLRSDATLVRAVLGNLVGNALKYTEQGRVEVVLRAGEQGHLLLEVHDTGPGIPREYRGRVFEPFEQLEPLRHKSTPGVGLGLALVKQVVEALQGRVELESEVGVGSTFRVVLPPLSREMARRAEGVLSR